MMRAASMCAVQQGAPPSRHELIKLTTIVPTFVAARATGGFRPRHCSAGGISMHTLLLPLQRALHRLYARRADRSDARAGILLRFQVACYRGSAGRIQCSGSRGHRRRFSDTARGAAQLSDLGAYPLHARRNSSRDPAVFPRKRKGRHAVLARQARDRLSARQAGFGQAAVRHAERRLCQRLRVAASFDRAEAGREGAVSHRHRRSGLRASPIRRRSSTFRR